MQENTSFPGKYVLCPRIQQCCTVVFQLEQFCIRSRSYWWLPSFTSLLWLQSYNHRMFQKKRTCTVHFRPWITESHGFQGRIYVGAGGTRPPPPDSLAAPFPRFNKKAIADAKVSARQQCVYEGHSEEIYIYSKFPRLMVNSNRGRITYGLRIAGYFRV